MKVVGKDLAFAFELKSGVGDVASGEFNFAGAIEFGFEGVESAFAEVDNAGAGGFEFEVSESLGEEDSAAGALGDVVIEVRAGDHDFEGFVDGEGGFEEGEFGEVIFGGLFVDFENAVDDFGQEGFPRVFGALGNEGSGASTVGEDEFKIGGIFDFGEVAESSNFFIGVILGKPEAGQKPEDCEQPCAGDFHHAMAWAT